MEQTLREIVARIAELPADFPADANLRDDLNVDSFRAAEIVFEIERVLKTKIPDERFAQVQTFNDVIDLVTQVVALSSGGKSEAGAGRAGASL
jgi:acyl carrier protein